MVKPFNANPVISIEATIAQIGLPNSGNGNRGAVDDAARAVV
jgi:hypothetical protein